MDSLPQIFPKAFFGNLLELILATITMPTFCFIFFNDIAEPILISFVNSLLFFEYHTHHYEMLGKNLSKI